MTEPVPYGNVFLTGFLAALMVFAIAYAISAPFGPEIYGSWVAFIGLSSVPALLVNGLVWHYQYPRVLAHLPQPLKGLGYLAMTLVAMIAGGAFLYFLPGKGFGPTPMLINVAIMSVVMAFWVIAAWKCWPLSLLFRNPVALGLAAWAASYLMAYLVYEIFFNFAEARHAPFYRAILDPGGLYDSWMALVFAVTSSALIVALEKLFDFWPVRALPGASAPPVFALYMSLLVLALAAGLMWLFLVPLHFEVVDFMLRGPIALLFGMFFVGNLTQSRLLAGAPQPRKGFVLLGAAIVIGVVMEELYRVVAPWVAHEPLPPGPPQHALELWTATALLGVTFPVIILVTGYFGFWPIKRGTRPVSGP